MTFEEAAALKILFANEEVQVITDGIVDEGHDPAVHPDPPEMVVTNHGIIIHDAPVWDVAEGVRRLADCWEELCEDKAC